MTSSVSAAPAGPRTSRPLQVLVWVLVVLGLATQFWYSVTAGGLDFSVYRAGAATVFDTDHRGLGLYDRELVWIGGSSFLPFTYPPFAALLFVPFSFIPVKAGVAVMMVFSLAVAWWFAAIVYDYVNHRGKTIPFQDRLGRTTTIALLALVICVSGPWRRGLGLVQINPLIMLLVLGDFLRPATRLPRGFLTGIAAGIKLTPLAFGLILLMRRDVKGLVSLAAGFLLTILLGFLLLPHQAVEFWTHAVSDPSRVGNINYLDNISIQGWMMHLLLVGIHFELPNAALKLVHYALALLLVVGVAAVIPALDKRGMRLSVIALTAFVMLEISPISWSHHNTWYPLIVAAMVVDAFPWLFARKGALRTVALVLAWVSVVGLYISPMWLGVALYGSTENLDHVGRPSLVVAALPIVAQFAFVCLWVVQAWKRRHESFERLPTGEVRTAPAA